MDLYFNYDKVNANGIIEYDGCGADTNGERFNITEGYIKSNGDWQFWKTYIGDGPFEWTHGWRYYGNIIGKVWNGGFHHLEANELEPPLSQAFFYPAKDNSYTCDAYQEPLNTTTMQTTTVSTSSPSEWLNKLLNSAKSIGQKDQIDRPQLYGHWEKRFSKFNEKYLSLKQDGCIFQANYQADVVEFGQSDQCSVSQTFFISGCTLISKTFSWNAFHIIRIFQFIESITKSLKAWGNEFTMDCNKVNRGTDDKWFQRQEIKLQKLYDRSKSTLDC